MSSSVASALTIILSIIVAVVGIVFFLPPKNREKFGKGFKRIFDFVNFKTFIVDYVLKGLYILSTAMCVIGGFLTIFTVRTTYQNVYNSNSVFSQTKATTSLSVDNIGTGLLIMVLGPIIVRIVYELIMLTIVAVRNIMEINKKMPENPEEPEAPAEPATPMEPVNPTTEEKIVEAAENSTEL